MTVINSRRSSVTAHLRPWRVVHALLQEIHLIRQFTIREVEGRYRGSLLGVAWSFVTPLFLLSMYTFVFGVVFQARWKSGEEEGLAEFALVLFCGFVAFNFVAECLNRATTLIVAVPNYVRKVVFPLEVLPVSVVGAALFHVAVNLAVLHLFALAIGLPPRATSALLPVVLTPLVLLALGLTWFVAGIAVYFRDVGHAMTPFLQLLLFGTPIFYPEHLVPEGLRPLLLLNPLAAVVANLRKVVLWGQVPDWLEFGAWLSFTLAVALLGHAWFMVVKRGFSDVI